jgi:hypothetical protein
MGKSQNNDISVHRLTTSRIGTPSLSSTLQHFTALPTVRRLLQRQIRSNYLTYLHNESDNIRNRTLSSDPDHFI